jgi:nitrate/nitrite-specific signal transduction histidine kinase
MFGIPCSLRCKVPVTVHNEAAVTQLYLIAQEAVTNAVKHANPDHIEISLSRANGNIVVAVKDDGTGIPEELDKQSGMGLKIMRYRAGIVNASLEISRNASGGTLVICTLPETSGKSG